MTEIRGKEFIFIRIGQYRSVFIDLGLNHYEDPTHFNSPIRPYKIKTMCLLTVQPSSQAWASTCGVSYHLPPRHPLHSVDRVCFFPLSSSFFHFLLPNLLPPSPLPSSSSFVFLHLLLFFLPLPFSPLLFFFFPLLFFFFLVSMYRCTIHQYWQNIPVLPGVWYEIAILD